MRSATSFASRIDYARILVNHLTMLNDLNKTFHITLT